MNPQGNSSATFGQLYLFILLGLVILVQPGQGQGSGLAGGEVQSIAIDPVNTGTVYAGTENGVVQSADGDTNGAAVNSGVNSGLTALAEQLGPFWIRS